MNRFIETPPHAFPFLANLLFREYGNLLIEAPGAKEAALLYQSLQLFDLKSAIFSPSFLLMERGEIDRAIQHTLSDIAEKKPDILITTPLSRRLYIPTYISDAILLKKSATIAISELTRKLAESGYTKVPVVQDFGEFAVKGDIVDISSPDAGNGYRIEFFDEDIDRITEFSLLSQRNSRDIDEIRVHPLLLTPHLKESWRLTLHKLLIARNNREIMEFEELIESGTGLPWDIYPLVVGNKVISDVFDGTLLLWEEMRGKASLEEELAKLEKERAQRRENGAFSPFSLSSNFMPEEETPLPAKVIHAASIISSGDHLEKFPCSTIKPDSLGKSMPHALIKKELEGSSVVLFTKEKESEDWLEKAFDHNITAVPVERVPAKSEKGVLYVVNGNPWFLADHYLHFSSSKMVFIGSAIFESAEKPKPKKSKKDIEEDKVQYPPLVLEKLNPSEYLVHYNYGIAEFIEMQHIKSTDCLVLKYDHDDKVFVPVYNMGLIYKYRWDEGHFPRLSSLRTNTWEKTKEKLGTEIESVAEHILQLYAERSLEEGVAFNIYDEMARAFAASFPYRETHDQAKSIRELESDLVSGKVVDRLLCGDVGFGKTEVAMRGCMAAVATGKQAAVLVPTTVLAFQHFQVFRERFEKFPVKIEMLSRFYTAAEQKKVIEDIKTGGVDIVIGTHRLLSKDIEFKELGFLVVDEEHRFGVGQKERIKEMKKGIAALSMTATPIPRTLQMSLLGLREVSLIRTAPKERKPVRTYLLEYSEEIIKESILREIERSGQVYFIHNRIDSLPDIKKMLENLVPGLKIVTAHGRMDEEVLEKVMVDFVAGKYNLLLSTSLIESGIDIPQVNTIIINRADMFGLAQLYQLRGRVGRSNREAYAYLMVPSLKTLPKDAATRLSIIRQFDKLGAGYQVAMEDLNIRGGGNVLGLSQTGKLKGVGYDLYLEMLKRRIDQLKNKEFVEPRGVEIKTNFPAFIPETYIEDTELRMSFYKKLSDIEKADELIWIKELFREMFGQWPESVSELFNLIELRIEASQAGISSIELLENSVTLTFSTSAIPKDVGKLMSTVDGLKGSFVSPFAVKIPLPDKNHISQTIKTFSAALR